MPIALSVENGTGVDGANSFATLEQARDYAELRSVTLTASDTVLTGYLVKATAWLKQKSYLGTKTYAGQSFLPWPRSGLTVDEAEFPSDAVPQDIIDATCQLCVEQQNGVDLFPTTTGPAVKREKIGPIDTEFAVATGGGRGGPRMPAVEALIAAWLAQRSGFTLKTLRI